MSQMDEFLPRHLTERAAALSYKAAAPTLRHRGRYGQNHPNAPQQNAAYSITSSARARKFSGKVMPVAFAILRLTTSL